MKHILTFNASEELDVFGTYEAKRSVENFIEELPLDGKTYLITIEEAKEIEKEYKYGGY